MWVVFLTGLDHRFVQIQDGMVTIPADLLGTVYAVVSTNGTVVDDETIVAGPVILDFDFDSAGNLIEQ